MMVSTKYFTEITTQKAGKSTCLLTSSPDTNEGIFRVSLLKSVLPFLTNLVAGLIPRDIV